MKRIRLSDEVLDPFEEFDDREDAEEKLRRVEKDKAFDSFFDDPFVTDEEDN